MASPVWCTEDPGGEEGLDPLGSQRANQVILKMGQKRRPTIGSRSRCSWLGVHVAWSGPVMGIGQLSDVQEGGRKRRFPAGVGAHQSMTPASSG